jgi:hypothetical protein
MIKSQISNLKKSRIARLACLALVTSLLVIVPTKAQVPPPDRRFGAIEAFRDSGAAVEAGVAWERILFYWSELQREGPDDWNGYHVPDEWLNQATAADREVIAVLKHTPAWATDGLPGCGVPRGLDLPVDDPGNLWAAFVRRVVGMYAGRIDRWVIWNEPDIEPETYGAEWCGTVEEYYRLLKVTYLAANQANPNVKIHLTGLTFHHDQSYLRDFLTIATNDPTGPEHGHYFDVVSLHIYFQTKSIPKIINETRATLASYGIEKPIWLNETNASPDTDPEWPIDRICWRVSLEEQAGFLLQSFSLALSAGVERIAVYKWLDNDLPPGGEPFGVLRPDHSRRPAFDAFKLITTHYAGTISASEDRQSLYTVVMLDRGASTTRVLWARTQAAATVSLPAQGAQARLIDQTGAEQIIVPVDGQYTLTLPGASCTAERPDCPVAHPPCIIGGFTYLLVEEGATPAPTAIPTALIPTETPTPAPTDLPQPTSTPAPTDIPIPTATPTPTLTFTPLPVFTATPLPTQTPVPTFTATPPPSATPLPSATPTAAASIWPLLIGLAAVFLLAAIIGSMFKYRE